MKMFAKTARSAFAFVLVAALALGVCGTSVALALGNQSVNYSELTAADLAVLLENGEIDLKGIVDLLEDGEISPEVGVALIKMDVIDPEEAAELIDNGEVSDEVISDLLEAGKVPPEVITEILENEIPAEVIVGVMGGGEISPDTIIDLVQNGDLDPEVLIAVIVSAVESQLPLDMQKIYDYLYNNPEEVVQLIKDNYDDAIAAIEEYGETALAVIGYVVANYGEAAATYVIENYETILADFEEWVDMYGDDTIALIMVYADYLGLTEDVREVLDKLKGDVEEIKEELKKIIYEATHADYAIDDDSFYVALGDGSAVSDSYVDYLAEMLGVDYENLAKKDITTEDTLALIDAKANLLAKADLITIGYTSNIFNFAVADAIDKIMDGEKPVDYDWEGLIGKENAEYVDKALEEAYKLLVNEAGMGGKFYEGTYADAVLATVEAYAYEYSAHLLTYPEVLDSIHAINPEALVVIVGLHNNIENAVVNLEGTEVAIGDFVEWIVGAANLQSLVCAILTDNTIYVHAPEVETLKESKGESVVYDDISKFITELLISGHKFENTVVGNEYVAQNIYNALNITVVDPDVSDPDVSTPDVSDPDVSTPDVSDPDVSDPDVSDVSTPDVSTPDVSDPDVSDPDVSDPDDPPVLGDSSTIYIVFVLAIAGSLVGVYYTTKKIKK